MVSSGLLRRVALGFLQEPHGVTTQKTPFFIVTAVKTSNLTLYVFIFRKTTFFTVTVVKTSNLNNIYLRLQGRCLMYYAVGGWSQTMRTITRHVTTHGRSVCSGGLLLPGSSGLVLARCQLWREVGSAVCRSKSRVLCCQYVHRVIYILHALHDNLSPSYAIYTRPPHPIQSGYIRLCLIICSWR
jgi:hypothetical protein